VADNVQGEQKMTRCLRRAEQFPDQRRRRRKSGLKNGGGDAARVCHAFAQFHRGEYEAAAQEFAVLAAKMEQQDRKKAASLHVQAGLAAMRAE